MASTRPDRGVSPLDRERPFADDELFFSTTDAKGVIRSGNDVFVRVSGYEREQLVGRGHAGPASTSRKRAGAAPWETWATCPGSPLPQFITPCSRHAGAEQTASRPAQNCGVVPA